MLLAEFTYPGIATETLEIMERFSWIILDKEYLNTTGEIEIIKLIYEFSGIKCKVCKCNFKPTFLFKENRNYYCSELCYNFI